MEKLLQSLFLAWERHLAASQHNAIAMRKVSLVISILLLYATWKVSTKNMLSFKNTEFSVKYIYFATFVLRRYLITSRRGQWRRKRKMIIEGLLNDDDSSTLIQTGDATSPFQNAGETYLSVSNELDISNNQTFTPTESCYQSDSEIEIHLAGSDEEGKSSDRERNEKLQQDLGAWPAITDVLNHVLMNYL